MVENCRLQCGHLYHLECLRALQAFTNSSSFVCPQCGTPQEVANDHLKISEPAATETIDTTGSTGSTEACALDILLAAGVHEDNIELMRKNGLTTHVAIMRAHIIGLGLIGIKKGTQLKIIAIIKSTVLAGEDPIVKVGFNCRVIKTF